MIFLTAALFNCENYVLFKMDFNPPSHIISSQIKSAFLLKKLNFKKSKPFVKYEEHLKEFRE